jgi:SAM-dependent methyltransferase
MKSTQFTRTLAVTLLAAAVAFNGAFAQQAKEKDEDFVPQSGQAGKDVVWVPTPQELVNKMLDMAKVTANDTVYDLGSGDGRTVITAAKRGAKAIGIEYNPKMVALAKRTAAKEGMADKVTFIEGDIFKEDFSKATVLTLFLLPSLNVQLRPTILEMKPGTRVVSNAFDMGDWEADQSFNAEGDCHSWCRAHYWMVPAKVEGRWVLADGELTLTQKYQKLTGTLKSGNVVAPLAEGAKMAGEEITFTAGGKKYTGKVNGNTMEGTIDGGGSWKATKS